MTDTNASDAGKALVAYRWHGQVAEKAAQVVISRAAELSPSLRAELIGALTERTESDHE